MNGGIEHDMRRKMRDDAAVLKKDEMSQSYQRRALCVLP
jgi:hypothetical protein